MLRKKIVLSIIVWFMLGNIALAKTSDWQSLIDISNHEEKEYSDLLKKSESLLLDSKFDELDALAKKYRSSKEMFIGGRWKLTVLYDGISYYHRRAPEESWLKRLGQLKLWVKQNPSSITARIALAETLIGYAYHKRSWKFADEVKQEQWVDYRKFLQEASDVLDGAKKLEEKCPGWWATNLRSGRSGFGMDKAQYNNFLDSAIEYEPTYNVYYFHAAWTLLPWWFGEIGDWEQFADNVANKVGGVEGDVLYARIIWFMDRQSPRNVVDQSPHINWDRVTKGIQILEKKYRSKTF